MRKPIDNVNHNGSGEPSAEEVIESIHSVMHQYRSSLVREHANESQALTPMDGKVLAFFAKHAGATQKDLVNHSGRDKGQLARLIAGLKERGLLEAHADENDRRNIRLQLTSEGRAAQRFSQATARRVARSALAPLNGDERKLLVTLLRKVHEGFGEPG